jgi:hypothetical protein
VHTDQDGKTLVLKMSGNVEKIAMVNPEVVHFVGAPEDALETTIRIVPSAKYDFSLKDQTLAGMKNIAAVLRPSDSGKKSWQLVVTNTRKTVGRYYEVITLKTDSPFQPELKIRVFGNLTAKGSLQSTAP